MNKPSPFEMTLSLNVLEHLGVNLYSNIPAVMSEVIANAWDADADRVEIVIDPQKQCITITDNGIGMGLDDINKKFLKVGYRRREDSNGGATPKGRAPMGRKGIGKLSLFSIASQIEVYSMKGGEEHALLLDTDEIEQWIKTCGDQAPYHPNAIEKFKKPSFQESGAPDIKHGTQIVIRKLKRKVTQTTAKALRKRLARRFGIRCTEEEMKIVLNDNPISMSDRDYFGKLEYIFVYGDVDKRISDQLASNQTNIIYRPGELPGNIVETKSQGLSISGWIGLALRSKDLDGDPKLPPNERDSLNKISVMARQKLVLENALEKMRFSSNFVHYAIGEIHADFLDDNNRKDIATSSRQDLVEHDPRAQALFEFLNAELSYIRTSRDSAMRKKAEAAAIELIPALRSWFDKMPSDSREAAQHFFGKINQIAIDPEQKKNLFVHAVPAFIDHEFHKNLNKLKTISDEFSEERMRGFLEVAGNLDRLESVHYNEIVSERLYVIQVLEEAIENNSLEKEVQNFLFEHLWLLDPSWERGTAVQERSIARTFEHYKTEDQKAGNRRVDIKFRRTIGTYVIVELKRPGASVSVTDLQTQVRRYKDAAEDHALAEAGPNQQPDPVEVVCVLGEEPREWKQRAQRKQDDIRGLREWHIHIRTYRELIKNARKMYQEYLDNVPKGDAEVLKAIKNIRLAKPKGD